jgi:hypothetical protein
MTMNEDIPLRQPSPSPNLIQSIISRIIPQLPQLPLILYTYHLVSVLHLIVTLHSLGICRRHRTTTASLTRTIIIPSAILILMNGRGHGSCSTVPSLRRSHRAFWYSALAAVCRLYDYVGYTSAFGILGELVVVGLGEFGDDVWKLLVESRGEWERRTPRV